MGDASENGKARNPSIFLELRDFFIVAKVAKKAFLYVKKQAKNAKNAKKESVKKACCGGLSRRKKWGFPSGNPHLKGGASCQA